MNRQMSAERIRRAVVTEAEGTRQAAVTVAEGEKSAAILRAEGHRQSEILTAEGDQQAAVLRAEGFSTALDKIHHVAERIDSNTLSLQYFDTLKSLGESSSTKFIFPMEFTQLLNPFLNAATGGGGSSGGAGERRWRRLTETKAQCTATPVLRLLLRDDCISPFPLDGGRLRMG